MQDGGWLPYWIIDREKQAEDGDWNLGDSEETEKRHSCKHAVC